MDFKLKEIVKHPVNNVYSTYRDKLPALVVYLPNVESIENLERKETPTGFKLLNQWKVCGAVPGPLKAIIGTKLLTYHDHADWNNNELRVDWRFEIPAYSGALDCHGNNLFSSGSNPQETEVTLIGDLRIDLSRIQGVPRFLHGMASTMEGFVLNLIRPNLVAVCQAVGKHLDDHPTI